MGVAMHNAAACKKINFSQIGIISEPQHGIRAFLMNTFKDMIIPAIRFTRPVHLRFIDISTATEGDSEIRRIGTVLPQGLGLERSGIIKPYLLYH
jgi:hypothetical protein